MPEIVEQEVTFPCAGRPTFLLEGRLARPVEDTGGPLRAGIVICHPQPATSSMEDGLVRQVAQDAAVAGLISLRFNLRGVGQSQGNQTDGRLEPLDLAGAVGFLLAQPGINPKKLALVGHAFGASMALIYAVHDPRIHTVVAISPP